MVKERVHIMNPTFILFIVENKDIYFVDDEAGLLYIVSKNADTLNKDGYYINRVHFYDDNDFYEHKF